MSETTRSRCLEPFFTTKGERGTGLGLPMVFGMVQRHGGETRNRQRARQGHDGAPRLSRRRPPDVSVRSGELAAPLPPLRILLIDDDPLVLRITA